MEVNEWKKKYEESRAEVMEMRYGFLFPEKKTLFKKKKTNLILGCSLF